MTVELTGDEKYLVCIGFVACFLETMPRTEKHFAMIEEVQARIYAKFTNNNLEKTLAIQEKIRNFNTSEEMDSILTEIANELGMKK